LQYNLKIKNKYLLIASFLFLVSGIYGHTSGFMSFRYGQESITDRYVNIPLGLVFFIFLNPLSLIFPLLILIFKKKLFLEKTKKFFFFKLIVFLASVVNINGLASGIWVTFYALCTFFPDFSQWLLDKKAPFPKLNFYFLAKVSLFPLLIAFIILVSFQAKFSDAEKLSNIKSYFKSEYIIKRFSVQGQVTLGLINFNLGTNDLSIFYDNRQIPINMLKSRLNKFVFQKQNVLKEESLSLSRQVVEYLSPFRKEMPRMGTSPGLIGTGFLLFPWYFAVLFLLVIGYGFCVFFQWLFVPIQNAHFIFLLIVSLTIARVFLDSFYDLFSLLRPEVFSVLFVVFLRLFCKPTKVPEAETP